MECVCPVDDVEIADGFSSACRKKTKSIKIDSNAILFDSNRLAYDPRPNFKKLSLKDFDRYSEIMFYGIKAFTIKAYEEIVNLEVNRLERTFRLRITVRDNFDKYFGFKISREVFEDTENLEHLEYFSTFINKEFDLIPMTIDRYFERKNFAFVGNRILLDHTYEKNMRFEYPFEVRKNYAEILWRHQIISDSLWNSYLTKADSVINYK